MAKRPPPLPAIIAGNISKTYGSGQKAVHALSSVSFTVNEGEVVGLIGPNGAGKSTLLRILLGFLPADQGGHVTIFGEPPDALSLRKITGYQADTSYRSPQYSARSFLGTHLDLLGTPLPASHIDELLTAFTMLKESNRKLTALSRGMRQKIELAFAFLGNPRLVFLDEPTAGLDPPSVFELREYLTAQKKKGTTVFFSSHNLSEVEQVCSRVFFIGDGRLLAEYDMTKRQARGFLEKAFRKHLVGRTVAA